MTYVNRVFYVGRFVADPEVQTYGEGKEFVKFCLANSKHGSSGRYVKKTPIYVEVSAFGKTAEYIKNNLHKGDEVFVEGELSYRVWKDKLGDTKNSLSVVAFTVTAMGSKRSTDETDGNKNAGPEEYPGASMQANTGVDSAYGPYGDEEDVPF